MAITELSLSGTTNTKSNSMLIGNANVAPAFDSIQTITVGAGGSTTIDFTNIPNNYRHLQVRAIAKTAAAGDGIRVRFNNDSTSSYSHHLFWGTGSSTGAANSAGLLTLASIGDATYSGTQANTFSAVIIDILDYNNNEKYKTVRSIAGYDLNGSGEVRFSSACWKKTDTINQITFYNGGSTGDYQQYSHFALYGIRGAS